MSMAWTREKIVKVMKSSTRSGVLHFNTYHKYCTMSSRLNLRVFAIIMRQTVTGLEMYCAHVSTALLLINLL